MLHSDGTLSMDPETFDIFLSQLETLLKGEARLAVGQKFWAWLEFES